VALPIAGGAPNPPDRSESQAARAQDQSFNVTLERDYAAAVAPIGQGRSML
jgi:hypothetical protein